MVKWSYKKCGERKRAMFKRKIYEKMRKWKQESEGKTALLIEGECVNIGLNQEKPYKCEGLVRMFLRFRFCGIVYCVLYRFSFPQSDL